MVIELIFLGNITYLRVQLGVLDHIYVFSSLRDKKNVSFCFARISIGKRPCVTLPKTLHMCCFWWSYDFIGVNTPTLRKKRETNCDHVGADAMHPTFVEWWCGLGILGTLGVIDGYMSNPKKLGYRVSHFRMIVRNDLGQKLAKMVVSLFGEPLPMEICCVLEKNNNCSVARLQYFAPPRPWWSPQVTTVARKAPWNWRISRRLSD